MKRRFLLLLLPLVVYSAPLLADGAYVRLGLGVENTGTAAVRDRDCSVTDGTPIFGCGTGVDGRRRAGRGDLGNPVPIELGVGYEIGPHSRLEVSFVRRSLDLEAEANLPGIFVRQAMRGDGHSTAGMLTFAVDLTSGRLRPFLSIGGGASRNIMGPVELDFPISGAGTTTVIRGGGDTTFAWSAGGGFTFAASEMTSVDLTFRYNNLGHIETDDGTATITGPSGAVQVERTGLRSEHKTTGVVLSVRIRI